MQNVCVHIISSLSGGPGQILSSIVNHKPKAFSNFLIVLSRQQFDEKLLKNSGLKNSNVFILNKIRKIDLYLIVKIRKILRTIGPGFVVSYDFASNVYSFLSLYRKEIIWFPSIHGMKRAFEFFPSLVIKSISYRASKLFVPSMALKKKVALKNLISQKKIEVIPNGIEIEKNVKKRSRPKKDIKIVYLANFYSEIKGHIFLLKALTKLPTKYRLTFIGAGKELENIKKQTITMGLWDRVKFVGQLENKVARELLLRHDIMVIPSLSESFNLSAVEGMAAGLPVIANNVDGLREVVDEDCGFLLDTTDTLSLAILIENIFEKKGLWSRLHSGAVEKAQRDFLVEKMTEKYYASFTIAFSETKGK